MDQMRRSGLKAAVKIHKVVLSDLSEAATTKPRDGNTHVNFCMHDGDVT